MAKVRLLLAIATDVRAPDEQWLPRQTKNNWQRGAKKTEVLKRHRLL